ncbi:glycoside hydrolase family 3 C-terminal domain-containing protein [Antarcticibacterium sp. 1MA-6-2]|uniref:glycoside hydrolase family 3 N-terminal domain-containing protein n=1 Tax=Antarcticibacterium sp. 1MA-6-2 TaxID=2908210 RepID=UPI001F2921C7|nr:glycoside hydrolase family 3 N-terminal domain-containing protein [Antarcticibacterium sp. 1MA-6-2]UJH90733.1 glycoside hydrolase family 3 C-terminal domain-containing protein [Antarcticibacterium sp. 1MA-6-2]
MKKSCLLFFLITHTLLSQDIKNAAYKDASLKVEGRVENLVSLMTLEEKIGQLTTPLGWKMYAKKDNTVEISELYKKEINNRHIGGLWGLLRADPWTQKTLETGLSPKEAAKITNNIQKYAIENSRLGIPLLIEEEAMHGHMAIGTTVFPTAIGQGSTWNTELINSMAEAIAKEIRAQGANVAYGPIIDIARDPRWSRVEETFGEDPFLISEMSKAIILGFQGETAEDLKNGEHVAATLKHFAAYGVSEGGHNGGAVNVGQRDLFQNYMYPVKEAVNSGVLSIMTAYSSIDGIPSTAHKGLLTHTLREEWGFNGFVISDLGSIEGLRGSHHIVSTAEDAAAVAMNAGVDVDLGGNGFDSALLDAVKSGKVSEKRINEAVKRVLTVKFKLGLFDQPYVNVENAGKVVRNPKHVKLAREVARQSMILLKNENDLLPLSKNLKRIAVIGSNADVQYNQLGDYTAPQAKENIVTVLEGIQDKMPHTQIHYVKGTAVRDTTQTNIPAAVEAAKNAEVAIVVLGGSSARNFKTEYLETGAATVSSSKEEILSDMESGEGYDRSTLNLMGKQLELLQAVVATGTPTVLVLIKGRPLLLNWPSAHVPAILDAWYPGQEGGNAVADVLFGDYNPAGRLPVSVPKSIGQLPVYYNYWFPTRRDYVENDAHPLYPFGYGLSYAEFEYSDLDLSVEGTGKDIKLHVSLKVKNISNKDGDEVVQLYVRDMTSSVLTPVKQLRGFERISLKAGEIKTILFELTPKELSLYNVEMEQVAEAGKFLFMIGSSSEDIRLETSFELQETIAIKN